MEQKPWEGVFYVPDLKLDRCPWCRKEHDRYCIVIWEGKAHAGQIMSAPCCERCAEAGPDYIRMRKAGVRRLVALIDFGFRR